MEKIHIMHVIYSLEMGGMENGVINLVNKMDPTLFTSSICCLAKSGDYEKRIPLNVKIFTMGKKEGHSPFLFIKLALLFKKEGVHIVHARNWAALFDGIMGAWVAKIPAIVYSEHGKRYEDLFQIKKRRIWTQKILLSHLTNKVVTVCEDLRKSFIELGIRPEKIVTIYNGVEETKFDLKIDVLNKKKQIGCKEDDIIIGTVGRMDPIKDYTTLLRAASIIVKDFPKTKFLFVGGGAYLNELKKFTQTLKLNQKVIFLDKREDVPELLKIMNIFVLTSLSEGLSNTIIEAMASALPVIATNVGGNPELIIDNKSGILVPVGDYHLLSKAIMQLIKNPLKAEEMGKIAQERVKKYFALSKMIKTYEELYKSLVSK